MNFAAYAEYSTLIDSGLVLALAFIVWGAYRELRKRGPRAVRPVGAELVFLGAGGSAARDMFQATR